MKKFIFIFITVIGISLNLVSQTIVKMDMPTQAKEPLEVVVLFDEEVPSGIPVVLGVMGYNVTGGIEPYSFEWIQNGEIIGTGDVVVITPAKGDQFSLKATDKNHCYSTNSFNMKVISKSKDFDKNSQIKIYPTLVSTDFVNIDLPDSEVKEPATIRFFDMNGKLLLESTITENTTMKFNLQNGTYFVSVKTSTIHKVEKIIVQH